MKKLITRLREPWDRIVLPTAVLLGCTGFGLASGCQTEPDRNLGVTNRGQDVSRDDAEPTDPISGAVEDFAGQWIGTAEDPLALDGPDDTYRFPSGSSVIRIELELSGGERPLSESIGGRIIFGGGDPPAPPTDPDAGYPVGVDYRKLSYFNQDPLTATNYRGPLPPQEGFAFSLRQPLDRSLFNDQLDTRVVPDGVLTLGYDPLTVLDPWCRLQTPVPDGQGGFSCVGDGSYHYTDGDANCSRTLDNSEEVFGALSIEELQALSPEEQQALEERVMIVEREELDCNRLYLCVTDRCQCTESGCRGSGPDATLSLRRTGDTLSGVFSDAAFENARHRNIPLGRVIFTRAE